MGQEPGFQFVVGSCHCSEEFLSRYSGFPLSSRTNILNSNLNCTQWSKSHVVDLPLLIPIIYSIFIYLFIYLVFILLLIYLFITPIKKLPLFWKWEKLLYVI